MTAYREMSLAEWVGRLPASHRASRDMEYVKNTVEAFLKEWDSRDGEWMDEAEQLRSALHKLTKQSS